jgi:uncharacterized membrane protein
MNHVTGGPIGCAQGLESGRGMRWWSEATAWLFRDLARLGTWLSMGLCATLLTSALHWFPWFGPIAATLLWFVLAGGLMAAARKTAHGDPVRFGDLFSGFGASGGALIGAGLIVVVACAAIVGLMLAIGLGAFLTSLVGLVSIANWEEAPLAAGSIGGASMLLLLLCAGLFIPVSMAAWLAPALIVLHRAGPVDALRGSLAACRRNLAAMTVYGLVFIGLAIAASLLLMIGWLFLVPLAYLSTYAAFRDLFESQGEILPASPGPPG